MRHAWDQGILRLGVRVSPCPGEPKVVEVVRAHSESSNSFAIDLFSPLATRYDLLCKSATHCNLSAFPVQRQAKQGWMPEVSFAEGEFAKIEKACGTAECKLQIDGTLAEVRGSDAQPAALRIANAKVLSASRG